MSTDRTTELLNLMSAMARDVGAMRQEINARFDRNEAEVTALRGEMNTLRGEMNARFDRNEAEVASLRGEMNTRFDKLEKEVKEIKNSIKVLRDDSFNSRSEVKDLERRIEILESSAT